MDSEASHHTARVGAKRRGGPAGIRTLDTRIKSPMLCQAELQAHYERGSVHTILSGVGGRFKVNRYSSETLASAELLKACSVENMLIW